MRRERRLAAVVVSLGAAALTAGCGRAPSFNILGSFFPSWLICLTIGTIVAGLIYGLLTRLGRQQLIQWGIVTYPSLAVLVALVLWLLLFN
ncbi:YtcA family lipoprotein [Silvibacterium sp.]|uniref:YtcA family lipoprotein n=1 Tax=Silvibacterium sp. TaxID=1964179 RepID=UPI0039E666BD